MKTIRITTTTRKVLEVFLKNPGEEIFGNAIGEETGLKPGTVYPILRRLNEAGWLDFRWEERDDRSSPQGRPARRYLWLTELGRSEATRRIAKKKKRAK